MSVSAELDFPRVDWTEAGEAADRQSSRYAHLETAVLVPNSFVQFLCFRVPGHSEALAVMRRYFEPSAVRSRGNGNGSGNGNGNGHGEDSDSALYALTLEEGIPYHPVTGEPIGLSETYAVGAPAAIEAFRGTWLPIPYLARRSNGEAGDGPTNWARCHVEALDAGTPEARFEVVIAFDTTIDPRGRAQRQGTYPAPRLDDIRAGVTFGFTSDEAEVAGFVTEAWVDDWIGDVYRARRAAQQGVDVGELIDVTPLEHLAHYLVLLDVIDQACAPPDVRLADPQAGALGEEPVDLALDIGQSRTCALLSCARDGGPDLIEPLLIRDLAQPWRLYDGVFPSDLQFQAADLGNEAHARWSGRVGAFQWPSLARIGIEAANLAASQPLTSRATGVISPTGYIWDEEPAKSVWRYAVKPGHTARQGAMIYGPMLSLLTETGEVLEAGARRGATTRPVFSRSALVTQFAAEVVLQALSAINHPDRVRKSIRRARLGRILLTVPAGLHADLQVRLRERIAAAIDLVWAALGWTGETPGAPAKPTVEIRGDAATNAQIAYLVGEIVYKFGGRASEYFALCGRERDRGRAQRTIRIASIDFGAGQTALSVATWRHMSQRITGASDFVESFAIGGDDLLLALCREMILPSIANRLREAGINNSDVFLRSMLAPEANERGSARALPERFAGGILRPVSQALLSEHVVARFLADDTATERTPRQLLGAGVARCQHVADAIDALAADHGATSFSLLDTPIAFAPRELGELVSRVMAPAVDGALHAIRALDCDFVLLAGLPSRLPEIADAVVRQLPTRPNRIIALHDYHTDGDYLPTNEHGTFGEPKLSAALGAMLGARVHEPGSLVIALDQQRAAIRRCVIGVMGRQGRIAETDVLFEVGGDGKVVDIHGRPHGRTVVVTGELPMMIGIRRLPMAQAPASPLYEIAWLEPEMARLTKRPLRLTLELVERRDGDLPEIRLLRACDSEGVVILSSQLALRLQTMKASTGHWIDTGSVF